MTANTDTSPPKEVDIALPSVPILAVDGREAAVLSPEGELQIFSHDRARLQIGNAPVLLCHAPYVRARLGLRDIKAFDILELFAFVHPARFTVPTPAGLSKTLGLSPPETFEDYPLTLHEAASALLADFANEFSRPRDDRAPDPLDIANVMGLQGKGWNWTSYLFAAAGEAYDATKPPPGREALARTWRALPEWAAEAPPPPPGHKAVTGEESRARLQHLLQQKADRKVEPRPQQLDYATAMTAAFAPTEEEGAPHVVLAEAGTGTGKTLGYLAPSSVWAEKNEGTVWLSTYTKNLQRQIGQELESLFPDADVRARRTAIRKGRENYLCLLNYEELAGTAALAHHASEAVTAGLMARWIAATDSGDLGGDMPGWLIGLLGFRNTKGLADKRGECIYAACDHYHRCFVEKSARKSERADIVVANHALAMIQTALATPDDRLPTRYVFDEGHHLFHAADSAFAAHLSARETAELRRWILGPEGNRRAGRARGLRKRVEDLIEGDASCEDLLHQALISAQALTSPGWVRRLKDRQGAGPVEVFLRALYDQVHARANGREGPYSLECDSHPLTAAVAEAAPRCLNALQNLHKPMAALAGKLQQKLTDHADTWDSDTKRRVESVMAGLRRRTDHTLAGWIAMLKSLSEADTPPGFVDWMEIERIDGQAYDLGLYRHYIDPMIPFAQSIKPHAHGIAVTSATLDAADADNPALGLRHLSETPQHFSSRSPFDYAEQSRIFVIGDVKKNDPDAVAAAYGALFTAAGGGALGLFTAIQRLRDTQERITGSLAEAGLPLYAQHVDEIDTGTLVDIFREDHHACLLGTDAVRDGVDVPGESLRLLVYDRVPWPRPTLLHKARRQAFGGRNYDETVTRMKLQQAYGRLIRRREDKGVFVMLDSALPTRLCSAFPDNVEIERLGLADAVRHIRDFIGRT